MTKRALTIGLLFLSLLDNQNIFAQLPGNNEISFAEYANSLISIDTNLTKDKLVNQLASGESGLIISNIVLTGSKSGMGFFKSKCKEIGFQQGIILSTGNAIEAMGPNIRPDCSNWKHAIGNSLLDSISGCKTHDALSLEFDFSINSDSISFEYIFASEEYPEFVNMGVNDVFAFWVENSESGNTENLAMLPNNSGPVTINNINQFKNSKYFINNPLRFKKRNCLPFTIQFDGLTTPLIAGCKIKPYSPYHIKLIIADAGDGYFDSAVLIRMNSFHSSGKKDLASLKSIISNFNASAEKSVENQNRKGLTFIKDVHFEVNSYVIQPKSFTSLDSIAGMLSKYFDVKLEIHGHCDNSGSDELNQKLSKQRANSIKKYLVNKGIIENRIQTFGQGSNSPLNKNSNSEERAMNRRVQFIVYQ